MRTPKPYVKKDGTTVWRVRYRHANGHPGMVTIYNQRDADEFTKMLDALGADRAVAWWNSQLDERRDEPTLDEWAVQHFATLTGITDGTRVTYERSYKRAWSPTLGTIPLTLVGRTGISHRINELSATHADKTIRNWYGVLASLMKGAVRAGHIRDTPCHEIRLPRRTEHTDTEARFLTHAEFAQLHNKLPEHYRPLFVTLIGTGMRWGEAEALTVGDVDLEHMTIHVNKAAKWNASKATRDIGPTKTRMSNRTITIEDVVSDALRPLVAGRGKRERLFLAPHGGQLRHRTVWDDWGKACEEAGLNDPRPRIHDCRHSHVAWLIAAGVPLTVIQRRLGHSSIAITSDRYGHLLPDLQRAAADAAGAGLVGLALREIEGPNG